MNAGVLVSGSGTNLQALIDASVAGALGPVRLAVVGANVSGCGGLQRAAKAGIPTFSLDHKAFASRAEFEAALVGELRERSVELVILAGFMRILGTGFLSAFPDRVVNIHPALLPAFPGVHAQGQAFAYGVKYAGCTIHFVDAGVDTGPIIAQAVVPVLDDDDEESLRLRILAEEHRLYPAAIRALGEGRVLRDGRRTRVAGAPPPDGVLRSL